MPPDANLPLPPRIRRDWALFLDVDGTLLELAESPDEVVVPDTLIPLLNNLNSLLSGAMAIVSGRSLSNLRIVLPDVSCHLVGQHGMECDQWTAPSSRGANLCSLLASAEAIAQRFPGVVVEDKNVAVALHWRGCPAAKAELVALATYHAALISGYVVQHGKMVAEVCPRGEKGDAVRWFMHRQPFRGRFPVFVGDDLTDETAFAEVANHHGIGVLVGDRVDTVAARHLPDVPAVLEWLQAGSRHEAEVG